MFITSVIMVVVMAIALTTSSLAWFTAAGNDQVTTSTLTLQAKSNSSTGLLLGNSNSSFSTTAVIPTATNNSLGETSGVVSDLQPVGLYGGSILEALVKEQFSGRYVESSSGTAKWASSPAAYTDHFAGYVYVANTGNAATNVSAAINFGTVTGATLYVAVLANKTQSTTTTDAQRAAYSGTDCSTNWEILAINASNTGTALNPTALGLTSAELAVGDEVASTFTSTPFTAQTSGKSSVALGAAEDNVAYSYYQQFLILAWYSADLTANKSGSTNTHGAFTVTFTANAVSA